MAERRARAGLTLLRVLSQCSPSERAHYISSADNDTLKSFCELVLNILSGRIVIDKKTREKLKPFKETLRHIADKKKHKTMSKLKKYLVKKQRGNGALLPLITILSTILPNIISSLQK